MPERLETSADYLQGLRAIARPGTPFVALVNDSDANLAYLRIRTRLARYAINRSDGRFWETYDWFQRRFDEDEPVRGGLLDLNRYFHRAD